MVMNYSLMEQVLFMLLIVGAAHDTGLNPFILQKKKTAIQRAMTFSVQHK